MCVCVSGGGGGGWAFFFGVRLFYDFVPFWSVSSRDQVMDEPRRWRRFAFGDGGGGGAFFLLRAAPHIKQFRRRPLRRTMWWWLWLDGVIERQSDLCGCLRRRRRSRGAPFIGAGVASTGPMQPAMNEKRERERGGPDSRFLLGTAIT